jgi:Cu/Ag efflux protein CusF
MTTQRLATLLLLATLWPATACRKAPPSRDASNARQYTVRGTVVQVMDPRVGHEVLIAHDAIPGFVDAEGESTLMPPMTMPFSAAQDVNLAGLTQGTPVEFILSVDWKASPPVQITSIKVVPGDEG